MNGQDSIKGLSETLAIHISRIDYFEKKNKASKVMGLIGLTGLIGFFKSSSNFEVFQAGGTQMEQRKVNWHVELYPRLAGLDD